MSTIEGIQLNTGSLTRRFKIDPKANYARRKRRNAAMIVLTSQLCILALIPLFWIIGYVIYRGGKYINLDLFTQLPKPAGMTGGGVLNSIEGSVILALLAAVFSVPIGLVTAFYAAYHSHTALGTAIRFGTDVLSGIPSIVVGIVGYALVVRPQLHYSALAGGVALAFIMLPTIIRTTEEMIKLVPKTMREGSLALGAPEWKTALKVTIPAAMSGIATGFLLGLARAAGETAPLLFTALGNDRYEIGQILTSGVQAHLPVTTIIGRIFEQPIDSLPLTLYKYTQQPDPNQVNQAWAVALMLLTMVLLINIGARLILARQTKKARGN